MQSKANYPFIHTVLQDIMQVALFTNHAFICYTWTSSLIERPVLLFLTKSLKTIYQNLKSEKQKIRNRNLDKGLPGVEGVKL